MKHDHVADGMLQFGRMGLTPSSLRLHLYSWHGARTSGGFDALEQLHHQLHAPASADLQTRIALAQTEPRPMTNDEAARLVGDLRADPQVSAGSTPFQGDVAASGPSRERMDGPAALTFAQLRAVNAARCERWHPGFPYDGLWSGADWSNAAAGEMGEACNVVKKLRRQETGGRGAVDPNADVLLSKLADEIADTIIYLDLLATYYSIDTAAAVASKFNAVSVREGLPERLPEGES